MLKISKITIQNFLSIGNHAQTVNLDRTDLTLVLGENLDLGGDDSGARNGVGKCIGINTLVTVRNTKTGVIQTISAGDLHNAAMEQDKQRKNTRHS